MRKKISKRGLAQKLKAAKMGRYEAACRDCSYWLAGGHSILSAINFGDGTDLAHAKYFENVCAEHATYLTTHGLNYMMGGNG